MQNPHFVGQYAAVWKNGINGLYVSNPGAWGHFRRGEGLDIGWRWPQIVINGVSGHFKERVRHEMLDAMCLLIDHTSKHGMQEVPNPFVRGVLAPLVHPELPDYLGWKRLTDKQKKIWENESLLAQSIVEGKRADSPRYNRTSI